MKNKEIWIGAVSVAIVIFFLLGSQMGVFSVSGGVVTREVLPNEISYGDAFTVIYSASSTGKYGVSIVDNVEGGCTFPDGGTEYREVLTSDGQAVSVTLIAPNEGKKCVFKGDYKFNSAKIIPLGDKQIIFEGQEGMLDNLKPKVISLLGLDDSEKSQETINMYVFLFYIGVILVIIFIIKMLSSYKK